MRLTRVHLAAPLVAGTRRRLAEASAAHLVRVLRMKVGDALAVFDGEGAESPALIASARGSVVEVELSGPLHLEPQASLALSLAQGISRGERMDYTVQKATELGVAAIQPVLTAHALVRLDATQAEKRLAHWRGVALAACAQCGRARAPVIRTPLPWSRYLSTALAAPAAARLILHPEGGGSIAQLGEGIRAIELLVGPEGGFAAEESRAAVEHGFTAIRLGPRILRTETAAVAALAALQTLYGDLA